MKPIFLARREGTKRCNLCFSNSVQPPLVGVGLRRRYNTGDILKAVTVATPQRGRPGDSSDHGGENSSGHAHPPGRPQLYLRCFPIRASDCVIDSQPQTPEAFHRLLCQRVSQATRRVQFASLYVGTGTASKAATASPPPPLSSSHVMADSNEGKEERELLDALGRASASGVPVHILLDANRAFRPVPVPSVPSSSLPPPSSSSLFGAAKPTSCLTTSSARACFEALQSFNFDSSALPVVDDQLEDSRSSQSTRSATNRHRSNAVCAEHPGDRSSTAGVYVLSVLPPLLQRFLPNPLNEMAGVFHLKCYVVDDEVILSGANLSREYFSTRIDRYLYLRQPDLVDFYSDLVLVLCHHGDVVRCDDRDRGVVAGFPGNDESSTVVRERRRNLQRSLEDLFTTTDPPSVESKESGDVVAYAIPTFQAPSGYFSASHPLSFPDHERVLRSLLESSAPAVVMENRESGGEGTGRRLHLATRIATAYLNPTTDFLQSLARWSSSTWFLTAGPVSHGFAPKEEQTSNGRGARGNVEDRSHGWTIPNVFRHAARRAVDRLQRLQKQTQRLTDDSSGPRRQARVVFYQRPGWTFHAKGMWLSVEADNGTSKRDDGSLRRSSTGDRSPLLTAQHLLAVCTGSGNFGSRSARRDMESNLVLIFPPSSNLTTNPLARHQVEEWNRLCEHASKEEAPKLPDPPLWIRFVFPIIRSFF